MVKHAGTRLFEMLKDDFMTDVTFIVQGTEIKGHRAVASCQGGLLRDLLMSENKRIEIDDITPQTLMAVLEYLYTDECTISHSNVFELMHAARKFNLADLVYRCSNVIKPSVKNVGALMAQALNFGAEECLKQCLKYFRENASEVIYSEEFLEISQDVLLTFCNLDGIQCSHIELFTVCIRWAENQCLQRNLQNSPENLRAVLGDIIHKFQFEKMLMEDFVEFVAPLEILTHDEVGKLIAGWQKQKKYKNWTDKVEVSVGVYTGSPNCTLKYTKLLVPLSTRISHLKAMKIFNDGTKQCQAELFTLEHGGKELSDDVTLASIYTPGKDLILSVHSLSVKVDYSSGTNNNLYGNRPSPHRGQCDTKMINGKLYMPLDTYKEMKIYEIIYPVN